MTLSELRLMPTFLDTDTVGKGRFHENMFRSYALVQKVKALLIENTPPAVVLEIIEDVEAGEAVTYQKEM